MAISNAQAEQELFGLLATHPAMLEARRIMQRLTQAERERLLQSIVEFMKSDAAFDIAMKHSPAGLEGGADEQGVRVRLIPSDRLQEQTLDCEIRGLPLGWRVNQPKIIPLAHSDPTAMAFEITAAPGSLGPAFDLLARESQVKPGTRSLPSGKSDIDLEPDDQG